MLEHHQQQRNGVDGRVGRKQDLNAAALGRRQKQLDNPDGPNPFVDETVWGAYLDEKRDALLAFMADPNNN